MYWGWPRQVALRFSTVVINQAQAARDIKITLSIPAERDLPEYQRVLTGPAFTGPARFSSNGQGQGVVSIATMAARSRAEFSLTYGCEVMPITYRLARIPRRVWPDLPPSVRTYLKPTEGIESGAPEIIAFARENEGSRRDPVFRAKSLYAAANRVLTYDATAGKVSAVAALQRRRGSCEAYARLFAALCRASGIPARLVYGLRLGKRELSAGEFMADDTRHIWNEVFLSGYGWIPVDPTFTYTVDGRKDVTYDYFGRLGLDDDVHVIMGYDDQRIVWTFQVPPGHPGLTVEYHLFVRVME